MFPILWYTITTPMLIAPLAVRPILCPRAGFGRVRAVPAFYYCTKFVISIELKRVFESNPHRFPTPEFFCTVRFTGYFRITRAGENTIAIVPIKTFNRFSVVGNLIVIFFIMSYKSIYCGVYEVEKTI